MSRIPVLASSLSVAIGAILASSGACAAPVSLNASSTRITFESPRRAPAYQLRITGPGPFLVERVFLASEPMSVSFIANGSRWQDGAYNYELAPVLGVATRGEHLAGGARTQRGDIDSGAFALLRGSVLIPTLVPESQRSGDQDTGGAKDQVIPDDLIVQGSACVGLDCVNNESFGFDTIRLKENNLRIKFDDTSTSAGFPATDWQLTANDSASGGQNKFSIEDITAARVPFTVEGGTPTNSLYVDSTGNTGFGTSTPVLDLHVNTSDTPGLRLEQNNSGGFTAQTWDVAGNEANFFVRSVTTGSQLPFRIRPGAPTSSLDIAANGSIGVGTGSPAGSGFESLIMEIKSTKPALVIDGGTSASDFAEVLYQEDGASRWSQGWTSSDDRFYFYNYGRNAYDLTIRNSNGYLGLGGVLAPANPIQHSSGAILTAAGVWQNASTREVKDQILDLSVSVAKTALAELQPVTFRYIADPSDLNVGFIAEDVPDLVATASRKTLSPMDIVAVLARVVQDQEAQISSLQARLEKLEGEE